MKKAFTLAEVLITLTIIGIIAALTIPALLKSTNNNGNIAALKKKYSEILQATMLIKDDNGGKLTGLCNDVDCWVQLYKTKLSSVKSCSNSPLGVCWQANLPDPFAAYAASSPQAGLVLTDGTFIGFTYYNTNCTNITDVLASCARIDIDTNGNKGHKEDAVDVFSFHLTSSGLIPFGTNDSMPCNEIDKSGCTTTFILAGQVAAVPGCNPPKFCSDGSMNYLADGSPCLPGYACVDFL